MTVTLWAVRAVADLAANNPNNQAKLGAHGACEALVKALGGVGSPREDERVAAYALWAIGNTVQLGRDSGLVTDAAPAKGLGSAVGITSASAVRNTQRLGTAGVVQAVAAAMARHEQSPLVLRWACRAVYNLARSKTLRAQFNLLKTRWALEGIAAT